MYGVLYNKGKRQKKNQWEAPNHFGITDPQTLSSAPLLLPSTPIIQEPCPKAFFYTLESQF